MGPYIIKAWVCLDLTSQMEKTQKRGNKDREKGMVLQVAEKWVCLRHQSVLPKRVRFSASLVLALTLRKPANLCASVPSTKKN
jgi:hypothetical protein